MVLLFWAGLSLFPEELVAHWSWSGLGGPGWDDMVPLHVVSILRKLAQASPQGHLSSDAEQTHVPFCHIQWDIAGSVGGK